MSYQTKVYKTDNGDTIAVASGGEISIASGGKITADGTQASHITDIATDATGTQIATAVNAILAALEDTGILASS